jgi:hypothetical protein
MITLFIIIVLIIFILYIFLLTVIVTNFFNLIGFSGVKYYLVKRLVLVILMFLLAKYSFFPAIRFVGRLTNKYIQ